MGQRLLLGKRVVFLQRRTDTVTWCALHLTYVPGFHRQDVGIAQRVTQQVRHRLRGMIHLYNAGNLDASLQITAATAQWQSFWYAAVMPPGPA